MYVLLRAAHVLRLLGSQEQSVLRRVGSSKHDVVDRHSTVVFRRFYAFFSYIPSVVALPLRCSTAIAPLTPSAAGSAAALLDANNEESKCRLCQTCKALGTQWLAQGSLNTARE